MGTRCPPPGGNPDRLLRCALHQDHVWDVGSLAWPSETPPCRGKTCRRPAAPGLGIAPNEKIRLRRRTRPDRRHPAVKGGMLAGSVTESAGVVQRPAVQGSGLVWYACGPEPRFTSRHARFRRPTPHSSLETAVRPTRKEPPKLSRTPCSQARPFSLESWVARE